jgi:HD-GYP domain-containing protein (c-di-GMP phosphodiesterase class II)
MLRMSVDEGASLRRTEVIAVLAVAADLGMGHPPDLALRTSTLAVEFGRHLGLAGEALREVFDLSLLRFSGCTADSLLAAEAFGDEVTARGFLASADFGKPSSVLGLVIKNLAAGEPPLRRAAKVAHAIASMGKLYGTARAHCEVAERLAVRLGLGENVRKMLAQVYERWDGRGMPNGIRGDAIQRPVGIITLAHDVELFHRLGGRDAALEMLEARTGSAHEPRLVARFLAEAPALFPILDHPSPWQAMLDAEPAPHVHYTEAETIDALSALGDFADLKSSYMAGHSGAVAALTSSAAEELHFDQRSAVSVQRAAFVLDLGRVGVSTAIWDKRGPLTDGEWEKVRLHPYYTERCFARSPALARIGILAGRHHERSGGDGYPKALPMNMLEPTQRVLAAADVYCALREERPHRAALDPEAAATEPGREAARGRLDRTVVDAVLSAAGHAVPKRPSAGPTLSDREREVLGLLTRGLSNKLVGVELGISAKTVGHHVQHIYDKIGVSTRAAATLFAVEHGLLGTVRKNGA